MNHPKTETENNTVIQSAAVGEELGRKGLFLFHVVSFSASCLGYKGSIANTVHAHGWNAGAGFPHGLGFLIAFSLRMNIS